MRAKRMLPALALLAGCEALNLENPFDFGDPEDTAAVSGAAPPGEPACVEPGMICTFAGVPGVQRFGAEDVPATASELNLPTDVVVAPNGDVYVMDFNNHRIRRVGADGIIRTVSGSGMLGDGVVNDQGIGTEGPATQVAWNHPTTGAFGPGDDDLWVAAWHNSRVNRVDFDADWVHFEVGDGTRAFGGDGGDATLAQLDLPSSVVFDDDGNLYVSDQANHVIRRVDPDGVITTIAGTPKTPGYGGDGGPALEALFHGTIGAAADASNFLAYGDGVLYVADTRNQLVRAIDLSTGVVHRVAGTFVDNGETDPALSAGVAGYGGDGGDALDAQLDSPTDVAVGRRGELYVADMENDCVRVIEDGVIDTFAGVCGTAGNDAHAVPAREALLDRPYGVAVGPDGAVYIADFNNQAIRVVR